MKGGTVDAPEAVGAHEDARSLALSGESIERASGDVKVGVGGGEDEEQDATVDDVRKHLDVRTLDGEHEGRGSGGGGSLGRGDELGVGGLDEETDDEDGTDCNRLSRKGQRERGRWLGSERRENETNCRRKGDGRRYGGWRRERSCEGSWPHRL